MHFSTALVATLLPAVLAAPAPAGPIDRRAPILEARAGEVIPGKYIIKLKEGYSDDTLEKVLSRVGIKGKTDHVYKMRRFKGFAGKLDDKVLDAVRSLPEVGAQAPGRGLSPDTCIGRVRRAGGCLHHQRLRLPDQRPVGYRPYFPEDLWQDHLRL